MEELTIKEQTDEKIRQRLESDDGDFDDELDLPDPISIIDIGDGPVAVAGHSDDEPDDFGRKSRSFNTIHNNPEKFKSYQRDVFIPGEDITVEITNCERNLTTHILNPNLYTLTLTHGPFQWDIKKRYKQIQNLHQQLILFRTSLNIPLPTKTHKNKRNYFNNKLIKDKKKKSLPRFPKKPEVLVTYEKLASRQKQLEDYLNNLLSIRVYRNHPDTIEFLEISQISFVTGLGKKNKEGLLKKKNGSTQPGQSGCNCFGIISCMCCIKCQHLKNDILCARWGERWFFVKDTYFGYINPKDGRINAVVLYDQGFEVASGMYSVGLHTGFQILTLSRQIAFKCWTKRKCKEWIEALKETAGTTAREFVMANPNRSYAPLRKSIISSWFVDGRSYMSSVADALENAKEEIFITDWWLSPEIYLKRPVIDGHYWRLDTLLKRKANQGVKIFILLYKEVELALGLNSYYSKQTLMHDNIKVLRHPDHAKVGVFLWAHHEKTVIVDQNYAFLGGIDLCYGRWDDDKHRLTDLGSINAHLDVTQLRKKTSSTPEGGKIYPIPKPIFNNVEIIVKPTTPIDENPPSDLTDTPEILEPGDNLFIPPTNIERMKCNTPESEKKSVLVNIKKTVKKGKNLINLVYNPNELNEDESNIETNEIDDDQEELNGSTKLWIGKDYVNFIVQDFNNLDKPFDDFIDRYTTPRMPWHDVGLCVIGKAAKDIARHFIHRWNNTKLEKAKFNNLYPYLLPKNYNEFKTLPINLPNGCHKVTCQALRSVSTWSCGFLEPDTVEQSIHEAYINTITNAKHYIYIENQFFITLPLNNPHTKNRIGDELYKRIIRAHKANETFRVYIVLPLLPGFEGEVGETTGTSLHAITHWNYASISRGTDAILNRLKNAGIEDTSKYITFYGLRNHSKLNDEPITELIYVHSKLMIVDDKTVICGSANINDRSLIGKRDSEIAVIIEDEDFDDGLMNGKPYKCGKFVGSLRKYLFKEHLGILGKESENINIDVTDPIKEEFYKEIWYNTASLNTEMYEKIFHCIPTDNVQTFTHLREYKQEAPFYTTEIARAEKMLETIQGHLVLFPLNFLSKELLTPSANTMEGIMPTSLWT